MTSPLRWLAALAVAIFLLVLLAAEFAYRAPMPKGANAPATEFSAARAQAVLADVLGNQAPHPLGSAANAEVRARIIEQLEALELEVEVQTTLVTRSNTVARVHNVLTRIDPPGKRPGSSGEKRKALLLAAHYDSVGAGPGASDDGVAVAAMIETARALLAGPKLAHPVILLIDDGEELGLFGARAFCAHHPWAKEVGAVINFEARGTNGASLLFETAGNDLALMQHAAQALARPVTGSAFAAVYRTLPNSTDLAVFRRFMPGLNFAFIGGARRYHTPLDDLAHADLGSVQHHGDNMLALARRLATDGDLDRAPAERAVFFDVLARAVVVVPAHYEIPAAMLVVLTWLLSCMAQRRRGALRWKALLVGLAAAPLALLSSALFGSALSAASIVLDHLPTPFPPEPVVYALCYALGGVSAALAVLATLARSTDAWHMFVGVGGFTAALGAALALTFPGASYVCVIPAAVMVLGGFCARREGAWLSLFVCASAAASAVLLAPFFVLLPTAIGLRVGGVHAAVAAWAAITLGSVLPALFGNRLVGASLVCALAAVCAVTLGALRPVHDIDHPARANIVYMQQQGKAATCFLDDAEPFVPGLGRRRNPLPWVGAGLCVDATELDLAAPSSEISERHTARGKRTVKGAMRSHRDSPWLTLWIPPGLTVERASVAGLEVEVGVARTTNAGWRSLTFLGAEPDEDIAFELTLVGTSRVPAHVADRTLGLPTEAAGLAQLRARALASPIHMGDGVVIAAPVQGW